MKPSVKIGSAALAAALSVVLVWAVSLAGVDVPALVASAFTTILSVGTGYMVPEKNA